MIETYTAKERGTFFTKCGIDPSEVRPGPSRDYAVRAGQGILVSFHDAENAPALLWIGERSCRLLSSSGPFLEAASAAATCGAGAEDGSGAEDVSGAEDATSFFMELTKNDPAKLREIGNDISLLEESFLEGEKVDNTGLKDILRYHRAIRRHTMYFERLELVTDELAQLDPAFLPVDHVFDKLCAAVRRTQEHLESVREAYQSQIDIEQNTIMKVLTIVTTLVLPLTLITGWYGMNLKMPEYGWAPAYPVVVCASAAILTALLVYFRHKKWF